jgi:divalent metal cation (Fe/Co/Zn/Cd) transporter
MVPEINWLAVVLATISSMVVGAIWYAKPVFGRRWMKLSGITDEDTQRGAALALIITFVVSFFTAAVLAGSAAIAQHFYEGDFFLNAVLTSIILWIGFTASRMLTHDLFDRRPSSLTTLNLAHELVTIVVMGLIIGAFGFPG